MFLYIRKLGRALAPPLGFVSSVATQKASDTIMSHGLARRAVLKRDSFSWFNEDRERSQIARTIFYGGSIFLTKCPLLETSNGIASRETEWICSAGILGEKVFLDNGR